MPSCLSRSPGFTTLSCVDSLKMDYNQSSKPITSSSSSLRRSLSADMASEKWKSHSGLRKITSLENLQLQDENETDEIGLGSGSGAFEDIWSSIQGKKEEEEKEEIPRSQTNIWSSILSQKAVNEKEGETLPPPYIHPLMKRSSSLSEKSLQICTESLGSETGSDEFSLKTTSDSDMDEYKEVIVEASKETEYAPLQKYEKVVETISCTLKKKSSSTSTGSGGSSPTRSFPPPLPSLAHRGDGSNVHMRSNRQNGRLVLEAVSVPSNICLKAEREDGRLLLTFSGRHVSDSDVVDADKEENWSTTEEEEEEVCDEFEHGEVMENEDDDEEESDVEVEEEEGDDVASEDGGTHKFLDLTRRVNAATWPCTLNKVVNTLDDVEDDNDSYLRSAQTALDGGLNPYEYSWRSKPDPTQQKDDVVWEGKRAGKGEEEVIPLYLRGCNFQLQPKRSVLWWEPRCIAT